jgi:hypothetical protein
MATQDWPRPKTLKSLHGFLGLTGYSKKYVKIYGKIIVPLTSLLKKNAFVWNEVAKQTFSALKDAFVWNEVAKQTFSALKDVMCTTLVLAMSNVTKTYVLECDASSIGLGAVLMQEGCHLAFTGKQLCDLNLGKSTYEKEMMFILHAIEI